MGNVSKTKISYKYVFVLFCVGISSLYHWKFINDQKTLEPVRTDIVKQEAAIETNRCMGFGLEEGMDKLLSRYKQVFNVMPAKVAGSSLKEFAKECMTLANTSAFARIENTLSNKRIFDESFGLELKIPPLISSHLYNAQNFKDLLVGATGDALIVFMYREETDRVISAIRYMYGNLICKGEDKHDGVTMVGNECRVQEKELINNIERMRKKMNEITVSNNQLLTCETYEIIKEHNPNVVFVHYKQTNKLQKLLSKHHCPQYHKEVRGNVGENLMPTSVVLEGPANNGTVVSMSDWLTNKRPLLEYRFQLKDDVTCQGTTRKIERELLACSDETLSISGLSYDGHEMNFPL